MKPTAARAQELWLLAATLIIAISGLIYELICATASSYLLGDSVTQFSFVIGLFLSSMGIGAYLSKYIDDCVNGFISAQILLGAIGGFSATILFFCYSYFGDIYLPLCLLLLGIGILCGIEIPLITRILDLQGARQHTLANVLSADYIGALIAALAFPLIIVPHLGLMSASLVFGLLNLAVAALSMWLFRQQVQRHLRFGLIISSAAVILGLVNAEQLTSAADANLYTDEIILSEQTKYQKIILTNYKGRTRLYLNASIQFDSMDEYRYHESLVHPAMGQASRRNHVLILGGGDGMAAREVLRYADVQSLTLVDLDPRMTELFRDNPTLSTLNAHALQDSRVKIVNQDAWKFVEATPEQFDVIIADLPDPQSFSVSKLYSREFYTQLMQRLTARGIFVTQAGSPLFGRAAYWSVQTTLAQTPNRTHLNQAVYTHPYHTYVPSFGDWGFVLLSMRSSNLRPFSLPENLRYFTEGLWPSMGVFPADTQALPVAVNSIHSHALVRYYESAWNHWFF